MESANNTKKSDNNEWSYKLQISCKGPGHLINFRIMPHFDEQDGAIYPPTCFLRIHFLFPTSLQVCIVENHREFIL